MNIFPDKVDFLLADDIRPELGEKITILGTYGGDAVILEGQQHMPGMAMPSLAILCIGRGGEGTIRVDASLTSPTGKHSQAMPKPNEIVKEKKRNLALVFKFQPFLIEQFGTFIFKLKLDDKEYPFPFRIDNHA